MGYSEWHASNYKVLVDCTITFTLWVGELCDPLRHNILCLHLTCDTRYAIKQYVETVGWRDLPFFIGDVEKLSGENADR